MDDCAGCRRLRAQLPLHTDCNLLDKNIKVVVFDKNSKVVVLDKNVVVV